MTTMALMLSPLDVWLFRDGRPFDAGDDHYARSLFPPYPSVIQGAIRSHHLVVKGVNLHNKDAIAQAVGTGANVGSLRIRGPFLVRRNDNGTLTRYFPAPADAVPNSEGYLQSIIPQPANQVITSAADVPRLFFPPKDVAPAKRDLGTWLSEENLYKCLNGQPVAAEHASSLFTSEHRYSIGIDSDRRVTREGLFFATEFIRLCEGVGLYVEVQGYDGWLLSGVMRIGGEGRGARFEQVTALDWPEPPNTLPQRFKLYFASPAYFKQGWQPASWDAFFNGPVTLQAVALRGYEVRGGYDVASGGQKPARRFVPAGSVYYFATEGNVHVKPDLIQGAVTEYGAEIGLGQVIISEWKE